MSQKKNKTTDSVKRKRNIEPCNYNKYKLFGSQRTGETSIIPILQKLKRFSALLKIKRLIGTML